ncbi:MAG: glycosyltransferase [Chitinophagaceae bacterium]|nr:glycosyltransferase [Chitinophagaceae bacterium]
MEPILQPRRVYFISLNSFASIPVTRFIIGFFADRFHVEIVHCKIKGQYNINRVKKETIIGSFKNSKELNEQSFFFRLWKHFLIWYKLFSYLFSRKALVYTPDYKVLYYIIRLKRSFSFSNWQIIYHQFEMVESHLLSNKDVKKWKYILGNANLLDLAIFPEINRQVYFLKQLECKSPKTILLENTCESKTQVNSQPIHPSMKHIPDSAIVFGHIGNVGTDHYFEAFLSIIELCREYKNVYFVVAGRYSEEVIDRFQQTKNKNFIFLGELPHEKLAAIYPYIDYGFILYKGVDLNFEYCAPNKLYEYWSYGVPVLAHPLKGLQKLFDSPVKGKLINFDNMNYLTEIRNILGEAIPNRENLKQLFAEKMDIHRGLQDLSKMFKADNDIVQQL